MNSTPEQRAKWRESARERARLRKAAKPGRKPGRKPNGDGAHHDAIVYLKHAERQIIANLRNGHSKRLGKDALLTLLALSALTDGAP